MKELVEIKKNAWTVEELLTKQECEDLVAKAVAAGIETQPAHTATLDNRLRDCLRVELDDAALADAVWQPIQDKVPNEVMVIGGDDERERGILHPQDMQGRWTPCGVNTHWRIVCYPGSGHFGPHRYVRENVVLTL